MVNTEGMTFEVEHDTEYVSVYRATVKGNGEGWRSQFPKHLVVNVDKSERTIKRAVVKGKDINRALKVIKTASRSLDYRVAIEDFYDESGKLVFEKGSHYFYVSKGHYIKLRPLEDPKDWKVRVNSDITVSDMTYMTGEEYITVIGELYRHLSN